MAIPVRSPVRRRSALIGPAAPIPTPRSRSLVLRDEHGCLLPLDPNRWHGVTTPGERLLLATVAGPVLDVGCGPGRIVESLAHQGVVVLGVDPAAGAVTLARHRGCSVLQRSVFDALPGEGRWATVLLLDGNVGIGGDPVRLLERCRDLVSPSGSVIVEVEPPGTGWRTCRVRLERDGEAGDWFAWSVVGADAIDELGDAAGLVADAVDQSGDGRWFAHLCPTRGCERARR
jgi:SAM-dependent methyltransferase